MVPKSFIHWIVWDKYSLEYPLEMLKYSLICMTRKGGIGIKVFHLYVVVDTSTRYASALMVVNARMCVHFGTGSAFWGSFWHIMSIPRAIGIAERSHSPWIKPAWFGQSSYSYPPKLIRWCNTTNL